jgi:hypothetical protein
MHIIGRALAVPDPDAKLMLGNQLRKLTTEQ